MGNTCSETEIARRNTINMNCYKNPRGFNCSTYLIQRRNTTNDKCMNSTNKKKCIEIKNNECSKILTKDTLNQETLKILENNVSDANLITEHMNEFMKKYYMLDENEKTTIYDQEFASYNVYLQNRKKRNSRKIYNQLYDILKSKEKKCYSDTKTRCGAKNKYWNDEDFYAEEDAKLKKLKENYELDEILKNVRDYKPDNKITQKYPIDEMNEMDEILTTLENKILNPQQQQQFSKYLDTLDNEASSESKQNKTTIGVFPYKSLYYPSKNTQTSTQNEPRGFWPMVNGGKSRKHKKYKKRTYKRKRVFI